MIFWGQSDDSALLTLNRRRCLAYDIAAIPPILSQMNSIFREQIKECCRKHYEIFVSALLAIGFVVFLSRGQANQLILYLWVSLALGVLLTRLLFVEYFNRLADSQIHHWHIHVFTGIMLIWGIIWAVGTIFFFPLLTTLEQAAWFAMFMVMISASGTSHAVYMPAFYAFVLPYFLGMVWMVASQFPSVYHINAIVLTLVLITQIGATKKGQKAILESLRLRFENLDLIDKLRVEKEQAEKANNAKSKFLAAASHDLRQPLHALTLFCSALTESANNANKRECLVGQIQGSINSLQSLFDALLDISRLDAGTLSVKKSHFDSQTLQGALVNDFTLAAEQKQLCIIWSEDRVPMYSDFGLIQQIMRNLIANAIRYTKQGQIQISFIALGKQIGIEVKDTGMGISESQQELIFDEFYQVGNAERDRSKGLGLGLAIVKRIAILLEHKLTLSSVVAQGSVFTLWVNQGQLDAIDTEQSVDIGHLPFRGEQSKVVAVVDDEAQVLAGTEALLSAWGFKVVAETTPEKLFEALSNEDVVPDYVLADYRLGEGVTGIQTIEALNTEFNRSIPALILTGDIAKEKLQDIHSKDIQVMHKPIKPAELKRFLQS